MSITPYKAVVPEDYTYLLVTEDIQTKFDGATGNAAALITNDSTTSTIDKSNMDLSNLPEYDLVGEMWYSFASGTTVLSKSRTCNCKISLSYEIIKKYRYIRFILKPNYTLSTNFVISTNAFVYINLIVSVWGAEYSCRKNISGFKGLSGGETISTGIYSFLFDTKTYTVSDITANGTELWSSRQ